MLDMFSFSEIKVRALCDLDLVGLCSISEGILDGKMSVRKLMIKCRLLVLFKVVCLPFTKHRPV